MDNLTPDKMKKITKWVIGVAAACIVIYLGVQNVGVVMKALGYLIGLVMPMIIGVAFALIVNVPMRFFESHFWPKTKKKFLKKIRRPAAYITSVIVIIGILTGIMCLLIPELIEAVNVIIKGANDMISNFGSMTDEELAAHPLGGIIMRFNWDELFDTLQNWLKEQSGSLDNLMDTVTEYIGSIGGIMNTTFNTISMIFSGLFDVFVAIAFSIYILFSKEKLTHQACRLIRAWLPRRFGEWFIHACDVAVVNFGNFISGQTIEALIIGVLCMVGMFILRIPYAPMVGTLVGVTALIPVVGAFIGAIVGAFMIMTADPFKALIFIIFLVILQQLEGNIIYPRVMGFRVNLPAMWILASVTVGGSIGGALGMLLSVPIASTAYVLIREATEKKERLLRKSAASRDGFEKGDGFKESDGFKEDDGSEDGDGHEK